MEPEEDYKVNEQDQQDRFIDADDLARSLGETRRYVLYLARTGVIRSYPVGGRERIKRKFRLSEVKADLTGRVRKVRRKVAKEAAPASKARGKKGNRLTTRKTRNS